MNITAVLTGATGGIGNEIARGLLRQGATVIVGVRNVAKGEAARTDLAKEPGGGNVEVLPLDVSNMRSVREFATAVAREHPTLQLLINTAGAWFNERVETGEGHELTLATNVLGPHLLTQLLLPQLRAGKPARIVNFSSSTVGNYDASDLGWKKRKYDGFKAYTQSKQIMRMMTWKLAQRLQGTGVVANTVDPGIVKTDFLQNTTGFVAGTFALAAKLIGVTPEKGAATPLWVALAPELANVSGKHFAGHKERDGRFREQAPLDELDKQLDEITSISWAAAAA
ncbi:SDR family NAD(P)-dependent oxidoreductase [Caballeronia sordidicola]|uniref:Retinol dehydrogenase 13 n=1 Tax=Caballeronia sordidicola TaxID=196367 RepID=A0A226WTL4_CABSO|nr:SDR family NAD(P)-dependent oxidoreductase [Caballeronia sordidicola]OXC74107.1 Retinol dehydrogenase 13 [Caballeronia sordidicola]